MTGQIWNLEIVSDALGEDIYFSLLVQSIHPRIVCAAELSTNWIAQLAAQLINGTLNFFKFGWEWPWSKG